MSIIMRIMLGLAAGFIASKIVNRRGEGMLIDMILGLIGSAAGMWLFGTFGTPSDAGLNLYTLFIAMFGAVGFLVVYHAIRRAA